MTIVVNGIEREEEAGLTVAHLLASLELGERVVAVELNGAVVPTARHEEEALRHGDRLEIVGFVGGG